MMKKFIVMLAMAASAMTVSAQDTNAPYGYYANKFTDNWYIGVNAGMMSKTTHQAVLKNANPNLGVRVGKWITPVVGFAAEGTANLNNNMYGDNYTDAKGIKSLQAMLFTQFNFSNIFGGYPGQPRTFEVIGNLGLGFLHNYGKGGVPAPEGIGTILNTLNQKIAIDFAWNFGNDKQWQFYVEPSITYAIAGAKSEYTDAYGQVIYREAKGRQLVNYDINYSMLQLNVGINYKFKTSNGHHNFTIVEACDQNQINALNDEINDLRAKVATIPALLDEIAALKKALQDCQDKPVVKALEPTLPSVFYQLNKAIITPAQAQNVAIAAQVMKNHPELKLMVKGYASPEGPHDNNNTLSVKRAEAVKKLLIEKYQIEPERITTEGCGETDKLFEIYEFNRVAMLYIER